MSELSKEELEELLNNEASTPVGSNEEQPEQQEEQQEQTEEMSQDEIEKAKKNGYIATIEEWTALGRDPAKFKSPQAFNKFGESYTELKPVLDGLKKKLDQRDQEMQALIEYNQRVKEREYQRARTELENNLRLAKETGDVESVEKLSVYKLQMDAEQKQEEIRKYEDERQRVLNDFVSRNRHWYNEQNPDVLERVNVIEQEIRREYGAANLPLTYTQLARMIELRMRAERPDLVSTPSPQPRPVMPAASTSSNTSVNVDAGVEKVYSSLNRQHKTMYEVLRRAFEKDGKTYSKSKFIKKLKDDGEI